MKGLAVSTNDMQDKHNGNQPLSPAGSPPEAEPVVVVEIRDGCFEQAYSNSRMHLVVFRYEQDLPDEDHVHEVDGEQFYTMVESLEPEPEFVTATVEMLKEVGVEVPGFSAPPGESEATSE
jgi:hypothetical protein